MGWKKLVERLDVVTITDLAARVGVSPPSVFAWKWLKKRVSEEHMLALCKEIKAKPGDFFRYSNLETVKQRLIRKAAA